jgi:tetratricopeptide (TPR) repeat protein
VAYLQKADFDSAAEQFRAALSRAPKDATLHYDLGLALKLKDRLSEAVAEFRTAEQLDPRQADVHYTLGVTLWQQGDFPAAADELHAAIDAKPDYAEAFYTLGTVLKQQGKLPQAAEALRQAIRLQPDFAGAHTTLAAVLRQLGDNEGAAAESKAGAELGKEKNNQQTALFATNSGKRLLNAGDLEGAISQFKSAIQAVPSYAPAHFQLGLALQRKGDKAESAREFLKAYELDPRLTPPS